MSNKFTIEDIHRLREKNYEKTKHMKPSDLIEETKRQAKVCKHLLQELRKSAKKEIGKGKVKKITK
ncbi:MAG: hypothetical protein HQK53_17060 [Oligoflexia bacterium]|nr:hypothetical protein [Oligoflexia bacterium]